MLTDFLYAIQWWAYIFVIGLIFLPVAGKIFSKFFDKGYLFSKTIGIAILSYGVWFLSSLRILPFYRVSIFAALIAAAIAIFIRFKPWKTLKEMISIKIFVAEELLFLLSFLLWSYVRGLRPELNNIEKFMDFGFLNSILQSKFMPPIDMWFAGDTINYYYFGQYVSAFLTKLTSIPPEISYNLMMATLFAFALSLSFSLTANVVHFFDSKNMKKKVLAGAISGALIAFGGNLHTLVFAIILPALQKVGVTISSNITIKDSYWFSNATRYIGHNPESTVDKTIHEFPNYSFVLADLHAHVINIPFVLTALALVLLFVYNQTKEPNINSKFSFLKHPEYYLIAFFIGIFQMTNYWDFPIYLVVASMAFFYTKYLEYKDNPKISLGKVFLETAAFAIGIVVLSELFALPFTLQFKNIAEGIGIVKVRSAFYQLMILWGIQLLFALYLVFYLVFKEKKRRLDTADIFAVVLVISAIGLIIAPEILYVRDIYEKGFPRANTMFKFTYQSFIMFCIIIGYTSVRVFNIKRTVLKSAVIKALMVVLVASSLMYSYWSMRDWYKSVAPSNYKGLDGISYLKEAKPDEYNAINWLRQNVEGDQVVLEANGDSYTEYCNVSAFTGLPTVLGWYVHEWLWRGDTKLLNLRKDDISDIYESNDSSKTEKLLRRYNIKYVVVGESEREKFKDLNVTKLLENGNEVFNSKTTTIIKIKEMNP